jgi:type I restriction enzyme S subunit
MVETQTLQLTFTTWSDETGDREDPEFYQPEYLALENSLMRQQALRLDELVNFGQQVWTPSKSEQPFLYIDIASVNIRTGDIQAIEIPELEAPSRARKKVRTGDLLVSTVRPERNAVGLIAAELDGAVCSTGFAVLKPKVGIDPFCLYPFLKSRFFIMQAVRRSTASMYPAVAEESLRDIWVPRQIVESGARISKLMLNAFETQKKFLAQMRELELNVEALVSST